MEQFSKKHIAEVARIKSNVENSWDHNIKNVERFRTLKSFVLVSTISSQDKDVLTEADKSPIEMNVVEPHVSRLVSEFSALSPELKSRAESDNISPQQVEVVDAHVRDIFSNSNYTHEVCSPVITDTVSGGFSVIKVKTDYLNEDTMDQGIFIEKVCDADLCGFDPLATKKAKEDALYCYQLFPKYADEIEKEYPHIDLSKIKKSPLIEDGKFRWSYTDENNKRCVYYLADYYEKKFTYQTMYLITDPDTGTLKSVWEDEYKGIISSLPEGSIEPQVKSKARRKKTTVMHYQFIESEPLSKPEETDYDFLPLVFVDGNSARIKGEQVTRPLIYNAVDAQRIKNLSASCLVNDLENMRQSDVLICREAWPDGAEFQEAWLDPQKSKASLVWNSKDENNEPVPKPEIFPRNQVNPMFAQINEMQDNVIQHVLGSYNAQIGIQKNNLSGEAIKEGTMNSNNASMPYVTNYMYSLNHVAKIIVNLLPKYYKTLRTIPIMMPDGKRDYFTINDENNPGSVSFDFGKHDIGVTLTSGPNFEVQKTKALKTIVELMRSSELFKAMIESKGLSLLIDNLDIKGQEQLKQMAEDFMREMEQKSQNQKNPQEQMMQAEIAIEQQKLQIEQQKLQLSAQKQQNDLMIQHEKLKQEQLKIIEDAMQMRTSALIRMEEANNEADRTAAELAIKESDHQMKIATHRIDMLTKVHGPAP